MTITSTSFRLDGDTALVVVRSCHSDRRTAGEGHDCHLGYQPRPCDTCDGDGTLISIGTASEMYLGRLIPANERVPCPDCDGTGRHTFEVEVENQHWLPHGVTFTVHVIDVLSIHGWDYNGYVGRYVEQWLDNSHHIVTFDAVRQEHSRETINLPPDAAPRKHLVRLAVHS